MVKYTKRGVFYHHEFCRECEAGYMVSEIKDKCNSLNEHFEIEAESNKTIFQTDE